MLQSEFARMGGLARAKKLTKDQLSKIGRKGAEIKKLKKQHEKN